MTSLIKSFFAGRQSPTNSSQDGFNHDYLASVPPELFYEIALFSDNPRFLPTIAQLDAREIVPINSQTNDELQTKHALKLAKMSEEIIFSHVEKHKFGCPFTLSKILHIEQLAAFLDMVDLYQELGDEENAKEVLNQARWHSVQFEIALNEVQKYRKNITDEESLFRQVREANKIFHGRKNRNVALIKKITIFYNKIIGLARNAPIISEDFIKEIIISLKKIEDSIKKFPDALQRSLALKKIVFVYIAFGKLEDAERVAHIIPDMIFNFIGHAEESRGDVRFEAFEEIARTYIELRNFGGATRIIQEVSTGELSKKRKETVASLLDIIDKYLNFDKYFNFGLI
ncbi:MAG: hypothetical protein COT84_03135 [Chlamydiae bacterium CG10_big_fil_rev_8_21_14_0_10_35_9]|nr:MAG: hypothetical protein COT84_03135 [Chlamydiae bacterium CG10_big_fil_rev_8_21_14_0_10_35_9]